MNEEGAAFEVNCPLTAGSKRVNKSRQLEDTDVQKNRPWSWPGYAD